MKFTETPPTEPGYYWAVPADTESPEIVRLFVDGVLEPELRVLELDQSDGIAYYPSEYFWGDRIEEPEVEE